ncbi:MAG: ATP-grasp fold amidoligase family protein [Tissierella sp.]|uniref:ATP-grasp fold amidoligase family protein n=1 Tax=Tissierella sp. TaxID=41274 RepID=UPI003F95C703
MILLNKVIYNFKKIIPDKLYLKLQYRHHFNKKLNLKGPKNFNEKIQWLKLNDRKPEYVNYVDKYEVRKYIKDTIGDEYLIPLIGVYDSVEQIDWISLPDSFVLKCTHGSSSNIICKNKADLDIEAAKIMLNRWLSSNWFWYGREWPYKNVKPRIVCEKYMVDESNVELKDYKIFCFNGEPKLIQVDFNRFEHHQRNIYDINWDYIEASIKYPTNPDTIIKKPVKLDEMLEISKKLSAGIPHVRVDLYSIEESIYFGELTFHHGSGYEKIKPESLNNAMGEWIDLSNLTGN